MTNAFSRRQFLLGEDEPAEQKLSSGKRVRHDLTFLGARFQWHGRQAQVRILLSHHVRRRSVTQVAPSSVVENSVVPVRPW